MFVFGEDEDEMKRLSKKNFDAGSHFSCWLREEMSGEIDAHLHGLPNRGLIKKYKVYVDEETSYFVMNKVRCLDDYPDDLKKVAVDIIGQELDENFCIKS